MTVGLCAPEFIPVSIDRLNEWCQSVRDHSPFELGLAYVPNLTRRDGSAMDRLLASRFASGNVSSASGHESANDDASRAQPPPLTQCQAA